MQYALGRGKGREALTQIHGAVLRCEARDLSEHVVADALHARADAARLESLQTAGCGPEELLVAHHGSPSCCLAQQLTSFKWEWGPSTVVAQCARTQLIWLFIPSNANSYDRVPCFETSQLVVRHVSISTNQKHLIFREERNSTAKDTCRTADSPAPLFPQLLVMRVRIPSTKAHNAYIHAGSRSGKALLCSGWLVL